MHYVSVEALTKSFGVKPLFENISFHVEEGDKIALVARNGSGKSTLLRILAGKETPDSGTSWINKEVTVALFEQVLLREEFDGPVAGAMNADLGAGHDAETVFETDLRTAVESEEVAGEIAEVAGAERTAEPVRDPECAREPGNLERGRQADDGEVRL